MRKRYPPLYSFSETEKNCFEFIHSLNFNNNFYSINGQASLQKSQYDQVMVGDIVQQMNSVGQIDSMGQIGQRNQSSLQQQLQLDLEQKNDMIKNSIFSDFFDPNLLR